MYGLSAFQQMDLLRSSSRLQSVDATNDIRPACVLNYKYTYRPLGSSTIYGWVFGISAVKINNIAIFYVEVLRTRILLIEAYGVVWWMFECIRLIRTAYGVQLLHTADEHSPVWGKQYLGILEYSAFLLREFCMLQ